MPVNRSTDSGSTDSGLRCKGTCCAGSTTAFGSVQSKIVKASTNNTNSDQDIWIKMVTPNNKLASMQCDFTEIWAKKSTGEL